MTDIIEDWCYWDSYKETDYILDEWIADMLPTLYEQDTIRYEYNQGNQDWSKKSCTIFQAIWAISDLWNYEFSLDEIKEYDEISYTINEFQKNPPRSRDHWRYVNFAVESTCNKWNHDHQDKKVAFYRIDMDDDEIIEKIISKNYNICTWFYGNVKWSNDYYPDAILNGTEFWASTYWHAINIIKYNWKRSVKDNYKGRTWKNKIKTNIYEVEHKISEVKPFHNYWFVITKVKEDNLEEVKRLNEFRTLVITSIENNSKLWHLTNDTNFQAILHYTNEKLRKKLVDIDDQLKLFN